MFNRFANRVDTCGSCAAANGSSSASSFCANSRNTNTALLLTMDNVFALSIFAALFSIIIRLLAVIIDIISIFDSGFERPVLALAQ